MSEQEMNAALDALEAEHGLIEGDQVDTQDSPDDKVAPAEADPEVDSQPEPDVDPEPDQKETAPGYLSLKEWVERGKDPADYKGENAYKAEYDRIQEIRNLNETMKTVVGGMDEWKAQQEQQMQVQVEQAKSDARAKIEQAKLDLDMNAALEGQKELLKLESTPDVTTPKELPVNPKIKEFFTKNPIVNKDSPQFDQEFYNDMASMQKVIVNQLTGGAGDQLNDAQINRSMTLAYSQARNLHSDKFVSKRNNRKSTPSTPTKTPTPAADYSLQMKSMKIPTSANENDVSAASTVYEMLKKLDPKQADIFAKNLVEKPS